MKGLMKISLDGSSGNMDFKKYFDKTNFVPSTLDKNQKRQSLVVSLLLIIFFIISAFTFLNAFYAFVDCVGSAVSGSMDVMVYDLLRSLPLILVCFMAIWTLLLLQASFRKVNDEKFHKSVFKDAICLIAFGGVNIIYIIVSLIIGKFSSLVEGSPTRIYPLDTFLYSIIFIAIGVFVILYFKKFEKDHPYVMNESRGAIVAKCRGAYATFMSFFMLIALFGFAAGLYSIFIYDFKHGYAFYGIMTILVYLLSPAILGFWEFYYNELIEEKKKEFLLPLSIVSLCFSALFAILYMVSLGTNMDAPSNAGFGMFPVAFAASVNIATLIMVFSPLVFSIVAFIKGLLKRRK